MRFTVTIESHGDALTGRDGGIEIARILRDTADEIEDYGTGPRHLDDSATLRDINGNTVGQWVLEANA